MIRVTVMERVLVKVVVMAIERVEKTILMMVPKICSSNNHHGHRKKKSM